MKTNHISFAQGSNGTDEELHLRGHTLRMNVSRSLGITIHQETNLTILIMCTLLKVEYLSILVNGLSFDPGKYMKSTDEENLILLVNLHCAIGINICFIILPCTSATLSWFLNPKWTCTKASIGTAVPRPGVLSKYDKRNASFEEPSHSYVTHDRFMHLKWRKRYV